MQRGEVINAVAATLQNRTRFARLTLMGAAITLAFALNVI
jgi:hypothetical protein